MATVTKFVFGVVNSAYTKGAIGTCLSNGTQKTVALKKYGGSSNDFGGDPHVLALNADITVNGNTCNAATIASNYTYQTSYRGKAVYGIYDGINFGAPKAVAKSDNETSFSTTNIWNATNPYSSVMSSSCFYINDYDMTTSNAGTNNVYQIKASDFTQKMIYYTAPTVSGYNRCSCVALNKFSGKLLALFIYYNYSGGTFTYTNSKLVLLPKNDSATSPVSALATINCNANASTITVNGNYVYVTSYGGQQVAGGNSTSKIEVIQISQSGSSFTMTLSNTITPSSLSTTTGYGQTGNFMGVEIITGTDSKKYAVVLVAKYNSSWTKYEYELVRVLQNTLRAGSLNNASYYYNSNVTPPGATWGLIKDSSTGELFVVTGGGISKVNATTSTVSVTSITVASDYAINTSTSGYVLNTATYNAQVTVSKDADKGEANTTAIPVETVQTVIRPHLTSEELAILLKKQDV